MRPTRRRATVRKPATRRIPLFPAEKPVTISSHSRRRPWWRLRPCRRPDSSAIRDHTAHGKIRWHHHDCFPRNSRIFCLLQFQLLAIRHWLGFFPTGFGHVCRDERRLEIIGLPRADHCLGHARAGSLVQRDFTKHRHLQQHQRTAYELDQCQHVKPSQSASEKSHARKRFLNFRRSAIPQM